jgi:hypothetical protein
MKKLLVNVVKPFEEKQVELGVTNVGDDVTAGDLFTTESEPLVVVKVEQIEVYHAFQEILYSGYTGTIYVSVVSGDGTAIPRVLIEQS